MRNASDLSSMGTLLKQGVFAIPAYQRDFAWSIKDVNGLLDDIETVKQTGTSHFIGSIVVMSADLNFKSSSKQGDIGNITTSSNLPLYHIVDGQQRITTCSLFFCALYKNLSEEKAEDFVQTTGPFSKQGILTSIENYIFETGAYVGQDYCPRLFLNNGASEQYQGCLPGRSPIPSHSRKLKKAFERIQEWLSEKKAERTEDLGEFYCRFRNAVADSLKVDDVCCDDFGSAFQMFESINAKGQPLVSADLIKCHLIKLASDVNIVDAQMRWNKLLETVGANGDRVRDLDKFFSIYLFTECSKRVPKAAAYDAFKEICKGKQYHEVFGSLQQAAEVYKHLSSDEGQSRWEDDNPLKTFKVMNMTSIYVPLMAAARYYPGGENSAEFKEMKEKLAPFAVRHIVCGRTSNALDVPFGKMIEKMKNKESVDEVLNVLADVTPGDDAFKESFADLTFDDSDEAFATLLLVQLEEFVGRARKKSEKQIPDDYSLEHIIPKDYSKYADGWDNLPENFEKEVVRSIGNLVLIGKDDNAAAGNRPYEEKLVVYRDGRSGSEVKPVKSYNLLEELTKKYPSDFDAESVRERAEKLADDAASCWREP